MTTTATAPAPTTQELRVAHERWTTDLLDQMPTVVGERYELIDGELYVTRRPHGRHQIVVANLGFRLEQWNEQTRQGRTLPEPGLVYATDQAVAPDLVWIKRERLETIFDQNGHLKESPDLVIEILSGTKTDIERDREKKLTLYSRQGVTEYWIVDWRAETIEIYRRNEQELALFATLQSAATLTSPLLPGFSCLVSQVFVV